MGKGFAYLFLLTDAYSRKIVGYKLSDSLGINGAIDALKMALRNHKPSELIHHSDRGLQYCNPRYIAILKKNNVTVSMTEDNHCYENAKAERVNGILKQEYQLKSCFASFTAAIAAVKEAISLYCTRRPHLALQLQTPDAVHYRR